MPGARGALPAVYGSCPDLRDGRASQEHDLARWKVCSPIFLENPDGTITEAVPSNFKSKEKRKGGPGSVDGDSDSNAESTQGEAGTNNLYHEVNFLYSRHGQVFLLLLVFQLALEILYNVLYITRLEPAVEAFRAMYSYHMSLHLAQFIYCAVWSVQFLYSVAYYGIAATAICTSSPKHYQLFANWSLAGIVMLILLAYVDKFNLLIFFLRLLAFIYSRFLQGLSASLLLLPRPGGTPGDGLGAVGEEEEQDEEAGLLRLQQRDP